MKNIIRLLTLVAMGFSFAACEEEIDLPLKDAEPKIVIEGNIYDTGDPWLVLVQETTPFKDQVLFNGLADAVVTITDGNNHTDTLLPASSLGIEIDGVYGLLGRSTVAGQTYTLRVFVKDQLFESTSTVFPATPIDSLYAMSNGFDDALRVTFDYRDPVGVPNYYKADVVVNGAPYSSNERSDDKFTDGIKKTVMFRDFDDLKTGDTIDVYFKSVDFNVYQYFYTLAENTSFVSAAPSNPISNISNGALGYFNASSVTKRRLIFP